MWPWDWHLGTVNVFHVGVIILIYAIYHEVRKLSTQNDAVWSKLRELEGSLHHLQLIADLLLKASDKSPWPLRGGR